MNKIITAIFFLLSCTGGYAQKTVINDPNVELRPLPGSFSAVKVSDGISIYLSQSASEAVAVSASKEKYRDEIKVEIKNNTLLIYHDAPGGVSVIFGNRELKAYVSFKTLEKIVAGGASDIHVEGVIDLPTLKLELTGASDFKGKVKLTNLSINASGASDAKISGSATNLNIDAGGTSDIKGYELLTDYCNVKATGASTVNISVNKELTVNASGASDINYKGDAVVKETHVSGSSSIDKKS